MNFVAEILNSGNVDRPFVTVRLDVATKTSIQRKVRRSLRNASFVTTLLPPVDILFGTLSTQSQYQLFGIGHPLAFRRIAAAIIARLPENSLRSNYDSQAIRTSEFRSESECFGNALCVVECAV